MLMVVELYITVIPKHNVKSDFIIQPLYLLYCALASYPMYKMTSKSFICVLHAASVSVITTVLSSEMHQGL